MSQSHGASPPKTQFTWTPAERDQWLDLFRGSRQPVAQFCREAGIPPSTLSLWLRQRELEEAREACESTFVQIVRPALPAPAEPAALAPGAAAATAAVTVHLPSGARIEVSAAADAAWVGELLRTLAPTGGASCLA
jgi:transposase-like protein